MSGLVQPHEHDPGRLDYEARKLAQRCTRPGCDKPPAEDTQLCARHLARKRRSNRASMRRRRDAERAAGRCACGCGVKSSTWLAPGCAIRLNRIPTAAVGPAVGQRPAGDTTDRWRRDNDGWERFRGKGRRGNPSAELKDEADLDEIAKLVERAREAYRYARSKAVAEQGRITKQAALDEADAIIALLARFADEVLTRHGK